MSTKRQGDSCYDKAGMDEPIFVLRAQDRLAAGTVRFWADKAEQNGCNPVKVLEARQLAERMDQWHTSRLPD